MSKRIAFLNTLGEIVEISMCAIDKTPANPQMMTADQWCQHMGYDSWVEIDINEVGNPFKYCNVGTRFKGKGRPFTAVSRTIRGKGYNKNDLDIDVLVI